MAGRVASRASGVKRRKGTVDEKHSRLVLEGGSSRRGSEGENSEEYESRAASSRFSSRMRYSSRYGSIRSVDRLCECMSEREIGKIKKCVEEKEKEERRGNIVIESWEIGDRICNM